MNQMTKTELCDAVTSEVMGWEWSIGNRCYQNPRGLVYQKYQKPHLSWEWAGRVIEEMKNRGYDFTARYEYEKWDVAFWNSDTAEDVGQFENFPEAVFRSALATVRGK